MRSAATTTPLRAWCGNHTHAHAADPLGPAEMRMPGDQRRGPGGAGGGPSRPRPTVTVRQAISPGLWRRAWPRPGVGTRTLAAVNDGACAAHGEADRRAITGSRSHRGLRRERDELEPEANRLAVHVTSPAALGGSPFNFSRHCAAAAPRSISRSAEAEVRVPRRRAAWARLRGMGHA